MVPRARGSPPGALSLLRGAAVPVCKTGSGMFLNEAQGMRRVESNSNPGPRPGHPPLHVEHEQCRTFVDNLSILRKAMTDCQAPGLYRYRTILRSTPSPFRSRSRSGY